MATSSASSSSAQSTLIATFSVSVLKECAGDKSFVVKNIIRQINTSDTWEDLFLDATENSNLPRDIDNILHKVGTVSVSSTSQSAESFHPGDITEQIYVLHDFDPNLRYVTFYLKLESDPSTDDNTVKSKDAFGILMSAHKERRPPQKIDVNKARFTEKDRLYNDIAEDMEKSQALFPKDLPNDTVQQHVNVIVNAVWYIDGSKHKIQEASVSHCVKPLPERFRENYNNYNDYKKKRKAPPRLSYDELKKHSGLVFRLIGIAFTSSWGPYREDLEQLALSFDTYAAYLEQQNTFQKYRHLLTHPVRQISDFVSVQYVPSCSGPIKPKYSILNEILNIEYQPVYFDEAVHTHEKVFIDRRERYRFINDISLSYDIDVLRFDPGGGVGQTVFMWRVPKGRSPVDMMSSAAKIAKQLESRLPQYHTREMKREFEAKYGNVAGVTIPPHILRSIYSDLTLDASAYQNPAIDERMKQAIIGNDPELVVDLRHVNKGHPGDTFSVFFETLEKKVETYIAADDRRHNVEHFSNYISIRDLIEQTKKECPEGTRIPSESTVLFAFVPKNAYAHSAKLYTSKIPLQHKVQTRQLRSSHIDEHYCAAVFSYLKHFAVKYRDISAMVCLDDKSKVDYGEPGLAISTGVRGKRSIVPTTSMLSALDHDVGSKGSLTPSVCLNVTLPEENTGSFYRGQVYVSHKDSVFQASSPFRHAVELCNILKQQDSVKPVLLLYSDGGPDHRLTYSAVKLSLIVLFKALDLDMLIAARTAPGHSWANPAERIMSLLNLAYQNVAMFREEMTSSFEQVLKGCNCMADIRKKAEKVPGLKDAWLASLSVLFNNLNERTERVQLKGENFKFVLPASSEDVLEFENQVRQCVDPDIVIGKYTKNDLKNVDGYHRFMASHCKEQTYTFQIRKCGVANCCGPVRSPNGVIPPVLPDPLLKPDDNNHYQPLEELLGKQTDERDMPSSTNKSVARVAEEEQGCQNRVLVAQHVRDIVNCFECGKPRCVYAKKMLTAREERGLKRLKEKYQYSCGALITPDGDFLQGVVFVRLQMSCQSPIEFAYYGASRRVGREDICCHCATAGAERDRETLKTHRVVLPICQDCTDMGKDILKRLPKK